MSRGMLAAVLFHGLAIAGPALACQCERYSPCLEAAATNLVFIGTVEAVEPMFLNRWNDTSQTSLQSLNDAFLRAQEHPSADALVQLKAAYLKTFPEAPADRKRRVEDSKTAAGVAAAFYSNIGRGMRVRFHVQRVFKHQDDDDDVSPKPGGVSKNAKDSKDDDDRKAPAGGKKASTPGRGTPSPPSKPEEKKAEDTFEVWTPFGDCGISFQNGETYLVYASDDEETSDSIVTDSCTRTRRLSEAGEDLAYLYFYKEHPEESTRIDGIATTNAQYRLDWNPVHPDTIRPVVPDAVIELRSGTMTRFTQTDQNGHFLFDGLPAGDYTLAAYDSDYPKGKRLLAEPRPFHLESKSCSLQILVLSKDVPQ